ncbi:MAG: toll/interleukin-1 receptor domain-containing protein [Bacteroidales bacterium]|nr:toll/interleukin-1 receptor domain-containing protein [Bacteroidales bacterium]
MEKIFNEGRFKDYRIMDSLFESKKNEMKMFSVGGKLNVEKTTVFISHKHSDLEELRGYIGFFEKQYKVATYIDSEDPNMPTYTSRETAEKIKDVIKSCNKFLLLATEDAIESKWCNWELGFGDANKYLDNIAIIPIMKNSRRKYEYKGNEYLKLYPYVTYFDGSELYKDGGNVSKGYYVVTEDKKGDINIIPLLNWFNR